MNPEGQFGEAVEMAETNERQFTAGDVRKNADLSYRQIQSWAKHGVLPPTEGRGLERWRRFTPRDMFAIMVCATIRRQYGVSLESLRYVREFMVQDDANHFAAAVKLLALLDLPVLLVTNLRDRFELDSTLEYIDQMQWGGFLPSGDDEKPPVPTLIVVNVAPIVRRLGACINPPIELPKHDAGRRFIMQQFERSPILTPEEWTLLRCVRSGAYSSVEAVTRDGKVVRLVMQERIDPERVKDLAQLLAEHDYQVIRAKRVDGTTVCIEREISLKPAPAQDESTSPMPENPQ